MNNYTFPLCFSGLGRELVNVLLLFHVHFANYHWDWDTFQREVLFSTMKMRQPTFLFSVKCEPLLKKYFELVDNWILLRYVNL